MLRRQERLGPADRAAAVRARPAGGDLGAGQLLSPVADQAREACYRNRKRGKG